VTAGAENGHYRAPGSGEDRVDVAAVDADCSEPRSTQVTISMSAC
jgi:hypothetical protein